MAEEQPKGLPISLDSSSPSSFETFLHETLGSAYASFPVSHAVLPGFGGSLIAKRSILSGEDVLRIPEKLFITLTIALDNDKELKLASSKIAPQKKSILAFFLYLNKKDPQSFYNPYLESIPKEYSNPITWKEEQLNVLRKELKEKYFKKQQRLIEEFKNLQEFIVNAKEDVYQKLLECASSIETKSENTKNEDISEQQLYHTQIQLLKQFDESQFLQFISMVESRTLFFKNREDPTSEVGAMVPFYDLANHSFMKGVDHFALFSFNSQTREYILRAYKDLSKGDQIFITYGNYNNEHFLEYYGFIPYANTQEALKFHVESRELLKILGNTAKEKIKTNQFIISQALSHLCNPTTKSLREVISVEVEVSGEYSWETNTLLQLLSIDLPLEDDTKKEIDYAGESKSKRIVSSLPGQKKQNSQGKSGKIAAGGKNIKKPRTDESLSDVSADKKRLSLLLEAVTSGELETLDMFNQQLFNLYKLNLRRYLLSLYDDALKQEQLLRNKSSEIEKQQNLDEITQLACAFTKHELDILNKQLILNEEIKETKDKNMIF